MALRDARTRAGLSQAELARRAGTSQPALARYETGAALPTIPTLERLLSGCGQRLRIHLEGLGGPVSASSVRGRVSPHAQRLRRNRHRLLVSARAHGVRNVRVFGSVARGEDNRASDVDLLVELRPGRTLLDLLEFRDEASHIIELPVDVATEDMLKQHVRSRALAEVVPL